jgi:hypothetical protein
VENVICEDGRKINSKIISVHNGVLKKKKKTRIGVASHIRHHLTKRIQFPDEGTDGTRNVGLLAVHPPGCWPQNLSLNSH